MHVGVRESNLNRGKSPDPAQPGILFKREAEMNPITG
jgi:hypothetical protein